jgi:riboflavin biosynthesis pyrimidine reductase
MGAGDTGPLGPAAIAEAYAYPAAGPWLRANMVASADGAAWRAGRTGALGGEADRRLLSMLRALADVVVVGASTVRVEGYGPVRRGPSWGDLRDGRPPTPPLAVVSRSLDLDFDGPLFTDARTIVITCTAAPEDRLALCRKVGDVIIAGEDAVDVGRALDALIERGFTRLLTEGGPTLLGEFAAAGRLDELCLTVSPQLVGGEAARIVNGPGLATYLRLGHALVDDDFLFLRYVRE